MKSSFNGRTWQPTLTLAKLFEEQNQFFDALAAYELIGQNDSSPIVREKIEALHLRILNDPGTSYDPRIEKLFTPEELAYLKILNHQGFTNLARAVEKLSEGADSGEYYLDMDELGFDEPEQDDIRDILSEIEQNAQQTFIQGLPEVEEYTLKDFLTTMLTAYDRDTKLSQISFADFLSMFLDMQRNKNKDQ